VVFINKWHSRWTKKPRVPITIRALNVYLILPDLAPNVNPFCATYTTTFSCATYTTRFVSHIQRPKSVVSQISRFLIYKCTKFFVIYRWTIFSNIANQSQRPFRCDIVIFWRAFQEFITSGDWEHFSQFIWGSIESHKESWSPEFPTSVYSHPTKLILILPEMVVNRKYTITLRNLVYFHSWNHSKVLKFHERIIILIHSVSRVYIHTWKI